MKKVLAIILSISLICSASTVVFATDNSTNKIRTGIIGTIAHEETVQLSEEYQSFSANTGNQTALSTMSYTENADGSYTIYQYLNGVLIEEHSTIPGNGIVDHTYYNPDGSYINVTENVALQQGKDPDAMLRGAPDHVSIRDMGYMRYNHPWTGTVYSISVEIYDRYYENSTFTFGVGTAKSLAEWTVTLLSVWDFIVNGASIALVILESLSATGLLVQGLNAIYTVAFTKTIPCSYYNQTFYGTATSPGTNYPEGVLEGTYAVVVDGSQTSIIREGYTVSSWGQSTFGRMMMYQVFSIDEAPTYWSNLDT
ncbi:MAG: hypothetical protein IKQ96_08775 [Lachnospiraceae bacterium]|nr:hypothetical protein [Lachnospiraceae bacterium]